MKNKLHYYFSLGSNGALRSANRSLRHLKIRNFIARGARQRSRAKFIGITGSSAKSTTTSLLAHILQGHGNVHCQVLGNTLRSVKKAAGAGTSSVDFVVAEVGVGKIGDMQPLANVLMPDIAIVTLVALEHHKSFRKKEAVAVEKRGLVEAIRPGGFAVLNADDDLVMSMAECTNERVITFGRHSDADYRVVSVASAYPEKLEVDIVWKDGEISVVSGLLGEHFWISVVAAVATAVELGVPINTIIERCSTYETVPNRCHIIPTDNGPVFIADAAKAPLHSLPQAMRVVGNAVAPKKRIVLGQLSDFPGDPRQKYRDAYRAARAVSDQVIFFGENAHRSMASEDDRESGRFIELRTVREVNNYIKDTAMEGEVIFLKSAQNLHLERVAMAWKYDIKCWVEKCGHKESCFRCGLMEYPFEEHRKIKRKRKRHQILMRLMFWKQRG